MIQSFWCIKLLYNVYIYLLKFLTKRKKKLRERGGKPRPEGQKNPEETQIKTDLCVGNLQIELLKSF